MSERKQEQQNMVPETDRARLEGIMIEHKHWNLWTELVEYLKFVRGELTTRAVIPPAHWKLRTLQFVLFEFLGERNGFVDGPLL
jgi:hypothetical protein